MNIPFFIVLHLDKDSSLVYVNIEHIVSFLDYKVGETVRTQVILTNTNRLDVGESAEDIAVAIATQRKWERKQWTGNKGVKTP